MRRSNCSICVSQHTCHNITIIHYTLHTHSHTHTHTHTSYSLGALTGLDFSFYHYSHGYTLCTELNVCLTRNQAIPCTARKGGGKLQRRIYHFFLLLCYMGGRRLNGHGTLGFHRLFQGQQGFLSFRFFFSFLHGIKLSIVSNFSSFLLLFLAWRCAQRRGGTVGERTMLKKQKHTHERRKTTCMLSMKWESDMGVVLCVLSLDIQQNAYERRCFRGTSLARDRGG